MPPSDRGPQPQVQRQKDGTIKALPPVEVNRSRDGRMPYMGPE